MPHSFNRIEKKFWMSGDQCNELMPLIRQYMNEDNFGESQISNIYCDTDDYYLIRRSLEKPFFKEKLRVRYYGPAGPGAAAYVELKRKLDGVGFKRRIKTSLDDIDKLLSGQGISSDNPQVEREIAEFIRRYKPGPKICIAYRRCAFISKDNPDLRISFDRDIAWSDYSGSFTEAFQAKPLEHGKGDVLMEVKTTGSIPIWLQKELSRLKIYQAAFSKVGCCYEKYFAGTERN